MSLSSVAGAPVHPRYSAVTMTSSLVFVGPGPVHMSLGPESTKKKSIMVWRYAVIFVITRQKGGEIWLLTRKIAIVKMVSSLRDLI